MSAPYAWRTRRRDLPAASGCIAVAFALSFLLALLFPAPFRGWNDRFSVGFFRLRYWLAGREMISPELVHVVVDDATYAALGLQGHDRRAFAQALDLLGEAGVRLTACDVLFKDAGSPEGDRLLVEAAGRTSRVILPLLVCPSGTPENLEPDPGRHLIYPTVARLGEPPTGDGIVAPFPALRRQAAGFGHINAPPDPDGRFRRLPLLHRQGSGFVPALALAAVLGYLDADPVNLEVSFGRRIVLRGRNLSIPIDRQGRILINFAGPTDAFQSFPLHKLLAARGEPESRSRLYDLLEGALVVLSDTSTANKDYGPGIFEPVYPLSGLHMNVINSLLTANLLSEQHPAMEALAAALLALALAAAAARFKTSGFALAGLVLYAAFLLFCLGLFLRGRIMPHLAMPTLGWALALLSAGGRGLLRTERDNTAAQASLEAAERTISRQRRLLEERSVLPARRSRQPSDSPAADAALAQADDSPGHCPQAELLHPEAFAEIVTRNHRILAAFRQAETIAEDANPVLITGESGVGKELLAKAIHRLSRRQGKFVSENIAGLDDALFTDTLFGHAPGAYTDARMARKGLVEEAAGGTLFLDEIGDLSIGSQVKLLRLIEGKEYRPLGVDKARVSEARFIIATNANLEKRLEQGKFRQDLYFRLTHRIHLPPLHERLDDLPLLVEHFLRVNAQASGAEPPAVPGVLLGLLEAYAFPGNIRELKNMIDSACNGGKAGSPSLSYLRDYVRKAPCSKPSQGVQLSFSEKFPSLQEAERALVVEALRRAGGNQCSAAKLLGLSASALSRRLSRYRRREMP